MPGNSKLNVMHAVLSLETGGLERMVTESALALDKDLFNVEVCCYDRFGDFSDILTGNGIKVTLLKRNQNRYDYFFPLKLRMFLKRKNVHILHIHSGTFFLSTQGGILAKTPVMIYTDHGRVLPESKIAVLMDRFSGHFVDKIIAVSTELEKYLVDIIRLPLEKTSTIINGISTEKFTAREKPEVLLKEFGITLKDKVIGTVGRLAEVKDQISLIEAFNVVHKKIPNTFLMLVGDGPMRNKLNNKIIEFKLEEHVKITGNRNDVPELLNLFDVFVLSSLSEGTSVALLEAMSSGIAPIVTCVGGNPSIVDNNINGILFRPEHVEELAENLINILQNDEKRKQYSKNAALKIRAKFSIEKMVKEYEKLYMNLLNIKLK
jgi:glycosyltransferase involved in cell wall biosynthesis